jgi:phytoene dehydrogenase-like protein
MEDKKWTVGIVGAGISGLIAAKVLEDYGLSPTVYESTDRVGGRVKTDVVEEYQLDHGFQVLLSQYPAAQKYLNYDSLELQKFLPGAQIFHDGGATVIGDAFRKFSFLFPTLFSSAGSFGDKLKVLKLNRELKKKSLETIFSSPEKTTLHYLQEFGFSDKMIARFFKPFFTGIFLETELNTSSRMFEFVYKMFGEGFATLPKGGIEEIPKQLKNQLSSTTFHFNTQVSKVEDHTIQLADGTQFNFHYIIVATEPSRLISNMSNQETEWKSCQTLYFETSERFIAKPLIGLVADPGSLVNNIFYHNSVATVSKGDKELLSVTVVKEHSLSDQELIEQVQHDLKKYCGITGISFLKLYHIPQALPKLSNIQYELAPSETQLTHSIFLAGDIQLNGSLNAAMLSGESAAKGALEKMGLIAYSG